MAKLPRPSDFDFSKPSSWPQWRDRYTRYTIAAKIDKEDARIRINDLVYTMGSDAETVYTSFKLSADDDGEDPSIESEFITKS